MNVEVLIATMNQNDCSLIEKMNIETDAIVGNQCDRNEISEFLFNGRKIRWLSFDEKGVGLNRNNTLMRARGDIILFADDDVVYCNGYEKKIIEYYETHPKADVVVFNFKMRRGDSGFYERVTKEGRVTRRSATKYGTYCITAKREKLRMANIYFHLDFGGGAKYSSGEDSLFLSECIKKKLKVYSTGTMIGAVDHKNSTWFKGYNDKFFFDKGILFSLLFPKMCIPYSFAHCLKQHKRYSNYGWLKAFRQMRKGIRCRKKKK